MHWTLIFSHLFGEFASKRFPPAIQRTINRQMRFFPEGSNMSEKLSMMPEL